MDVGQAARSGRLDADRVRAMFDRISGVYDLMNTAMTAGLHHRWRERAADIAQVGPGSRALDVATGTGDMAIELARRVPLLGRLAGGIMGLASLLGRSASNGAIADAYTSLPSSVRRFPGPMALAAELERAGLCDVRYLLIAGGIVAIHAGTVSAESA